MKVKDEMHFPGLIFDPCFVVIWRLESQMRWHFYSESLLVFAAMHLGRGQSEYLFNFVRDGGEC